MTTWWRNTGNKYKTDRNYRKRPRYASNEQIV